MRIVVAGAKGLLGHEVAHVLRTSGHELIAADLEEDLLHDIAALDITQPAMVRGFLEATRPAWLINCAAYTQVDDCEEHEEVAFQVNGKAPGFLAEACNETGATLLHVSTDYVFDGTKDSPYTEDDLPNPLNVYGRSKLAGEEAIRCVTDKFIIVRPQWMFGPYGANFVSTILNKAREQDKVEVVDDQWGSPTYSKDLAKAIKLLLECDARGIFHVCNRGQATWFDLAKKAIALAELETEVIPVGTQRFPRPAKRPRNSLLSTKKFRDTTGKLLPPWQISLQDYLKEYLQEFRQGRHG